MCSSLETQANFSNPAVTKILVIIKMDINDTKKLYRMINQSKTS
jgi:hypothetical protein